MFDRYNIMDEDLASAVAKRSLRVLQDKRPS